MLDMVAGAEEFGDLAGNDDHRDGTRQFLAQF
jgi:hypothetical protein